MPEGIAVAEGPQETAAHVLEDAQPRKDVRDLEGAAEPPPVDLVGRAPATVSAVKASHGTGVRTAMVVQNSRLVAAAAGAVTRKWIISRSPTTPTRATTAANATARYGETR